jgi:hypothetical protein
MSILAKALYENSSDLLSNIHRMIFVSIAAAQFFDIVTSPGFDYT